MRAAIARFLTEYGAYLAVAAFGVALQVIAIEIDAFDNLYHYSRAHEDWELDELFMLFVTASITFALLAWTYGRKLWREVDRRKIAESRASELAQHDPLTDLVNRRFFIEELETRIAAARAAAFPLHVLLLDLDRFKPVNDVMGHAAGDAVLNAVAARLTEIMPEDALIARLGGDEFAVAITGKSEGAVQGLAEKLLAVLKQPIEIDACAVEIGASVGVAAMSDETTPADLINHADQAMYAAKRSGRGQVAEFDDQLDRQTKRRARLEADLRAAVREGRIEPYFQPLVSLATGETNSFEVLSRWRHPEYGAILPDEFIPIAEQTGVIGELSWSVLRKACAVAAQLSPRDVKLSFNLASVQFRDRHLARKITAILADTGFPPNRLEVELTESAIVEKPEQAREILQALKSSGVRVALDDFGTGYASVTSLLSLPFDKVKIDRRFVTNGRDDPRREKVVEAILGLTHSLELIATAEGVESDLDLAWLRALGCDEAQGFYFAQPMPADQVEWYLDSAADRGGVGLRLVESPVAEPKAS